MITSRGGGIRTLDLLNPIQARCQAAPHPGYVSDELRSESVATRHVFELSRWNSSAGALPTLRQQIAYIAYSSEPSAGDRNSRVRMATQTMRCIAFEAELRSKALQCELCLIRLDRAKPSACLREHVVDGFGALGHPPEVIGIAMSFDSPKALECLLQPYQRIGRGAHLAMLTGRHANT